jgi:hypothetical protein
MWWIPLKWKAHTVWSTKSCMQLLSILFAFAKLYIWNIFINKNMKIYCFYHRGHTEWQWQLSAVHYIMMVKSAQPSVAGDKRPPPFTIISTVTFKVVSYAPAERADTLPLILLYPCMNSVVLPHNLNPNNFFFRHKILAKTFFVSLKCL